MMAVPERRRGTSTLKKRNLRRAPTFVRYQQEKKMAGESTHGEKGHSGGMSMYVRFMAMIGTSKDVMFGLMYLNPYRIDHVFWSETLFWMGFCIGPAMMVVMPAFMWGMYKERTKNF